MEIFYADLLSIKLSQNNFQYLVNESWEFLSLARRN